MPPERLRNLLHRAIASDRATKGNIQLLDARENTLRIIAQEGFEAEFLRHFETVRLFDSSACGRAAGAGSCILIPDVMSDPGFEPHRKVALAAGFRSVKSVPLVSQDGVLRGVLSTHCPFVRWDWERENTRPIAAEIAAILAEPAFAEHAA